jgi:hypothetical protein
MSPTLRRIIWSDGTSPDDYNIIHDGQIVGRQMPTAVGSSLKTGT